VHLFIYRDRVMARMLPFALSPGSPISERGRS
jgi:hypothetical protein